MSADTAVTAIVVAWNSAGALPECLEALNREGVAVIVVDNASDDDTAAVAAAHGARIIRNARNEGYGRGNNIGAAAVASDYILIINPDCAPDPGCVAALVAAAERWPDAGMLAPRIIEPDGRLFFQRRSLLSPYLTNPPDILRLPEGDCCAPFLSGACLLMRRAVFQRLGGYDPHIFLFYEDDDLCRRVADADLALVHVHDAIARHGRGKSAGRAPGRIFRTRWHMAWSQAYVARKWGLASPALATALVNGCKTLLALFSFRRATIERYAGSAAGALAFLRGRQAVTREHLEPAPDEQDKRQTE